MSKVLSSPVPEFPGTITLPDVLPIRKVADFDAAMKESYSVTSTPEKAACVLPSLVACLESLDIKGQPEKEKANNDTFVYTPFAAADKLYEWMLDSVMTLIIGEKSIPKEPPSAPTDTPQVTTENPTN